MPLGLGPHTLHRPDYSLRIQHLDGPVSLRRKVTAPGLAPVAATLYPKPRPSWLSRREGSSAPAP